MELGEKLRQARLEAGLSQRQLCGEEITRNMLSQIENGSAKPSMGTLVYLAGRLGKPVSYFLDEAAVVSPNREVMESARRLYDAGEYAQGLLALEAYRETDDVYDRERELLLVLMLLGRAEEALREGREPFAKELLEKADRKTVYCSEAVERKRLLLLGRLRGERVSERLPSLDEELMIRAEEVFEENPDRAGRLLDAVEDQKNSRWCLMRGKVYMAGKTYPSAVDCLLKAEDADPRQAVPLLEECYREMGDFKRAYEYACKGR